MATAAGSIDRASETGMSTDPGLSQLNSGDPHQQTFTMGVPSTRPELGTHTASTLHRQDWKNVVRQNLLACNDAITRQLQFCQMIQKTTSPETSSMFLLEKALFDMATSGLSEGCIYGIVFRHCGKNFLRYFESGVYNGFFESKGLSLIKASFENFSDKELFWEKAFTEEDIQKMTERYQSNLANKRSNKLDPSSDAGQVRAAESQKLPAAGRRYKNILAENKNSIQNSLESLLLHIQTRTFQENAVECLGVLVHVEKKKSFKDKTCEKYKEMKIHKLDAGHMNKMATYPYFCKNPSKTFFSRTGGQISMKLGM